MSPFTMAPFVRWFIRPRPLATRIMLTSFASRLNESAKICERTVATFGGASISIPDNQERCDSTIRSRGLTLDDCMRDDYAARATLCHPFGTPTRSRPRHKDHVKQADRLPVLRVFPFLQKRESPRRRPYSYFSTAITIPPLLQIISILCESRSSL